MNVTKMRTSPAKTAQDDGMAPLIAIVGCDGSGKTTLASWVSSTLPGVPPTYCYLGLGSGNIAAKIANWPLIGKLLVRRLSSKARQARTKGERIPGGITALVIYAFTLLRMHRFKHMLRLRREGQAVICDRYPQIEVAGFSDGPGLSAAAPKGPFTAWLARRERRLFARMAAYRPTLVIRLNIDADTAYARKPDHDLSLLRAKVEATPKLEFNGARIVELDARQPLVEVKAKIQELVQNVLADYQQPPTPKPVTLHKRQEPARVSHSAAREKSEQHKQPIAS